MEANQNHTLHDGERKNIDQEEEILETSGKRKANDKRCIFLLHSYFGKSRYRAPNDCASINTLPLLLYLLVVKVCIVSC